MKRRKTTTGLNSRFDRMIETVNILHTSPTSSKSSRSGGRRRAASSSSASAVEFEMPRTPVDAYSPGGRLGPDFVVMKMRDSESSVDLGFSGRYAFETPSSCDSPSIPAWLSNTLSTLDTHHPLRRLMYMDSTSHEVAPAATLESHVEPVDVPYHAPPAEQVADHEPIFAFNAPRGPAAEATARAIDAGPPASDRLVDSTEHGALLGLLELPFVSPHCSPILDGSMFTESPLVPFSTPGPASSVSAIPPSVFSLGSVRRSTNSFLASLHEANIAEQSGHEQHDYAFAAPTSSIASVQPASLIVAAANTGGDPFGVPPGNHEDPLLSIPPQLPDRGHALRMHYTASEYHDYMRAAGGAVQQTPSPTLDDVMLPSMWRSAMQTGMGLSPIQRTTKSNTPQPRTEGWDIPQTPGLVDATPVRSVSARPVRIYFDSPAEDPCSSDALDVESYVLPDDPASLDFKWEKFDRGRVGGTHTPDSSSDGIDPSVVATHRTPSVPEEQWVPRTPVLVTAYSSSSSGIPHLDKQPSEDNDDGTWIIPMPAASALSGASYPSRGHKAASGRIAESVCQPLQSVFAPAPGVSISPLRKTGEDDDNPSPEVGFHGLF